MPVKVGEGRAPLCDRADAGRHGERAGEGTAAGVPTQTPDRRYADRVSESESPEEQAAVHLDASARRMVARWAGNPLLVQAVNELRPDFRTLLDELAIDAADEKLLVAARMLGLGPVDQDGIELPNPFAAWPPERRAPAQLIASRLRTGLAELVERLCSSGVGGLSRIEHVTPDADTPDGLAFSFDHLELLSLLWLDIPLDGRSGTEIAADLPMLGNVGWVRGRSVLLVGDASQPDLLAGDTLRRAFLRRSEQPETPEAADTAAAVYRFADAEFRLDQSMPDFEPPANAIERHRLPGWTGLAEAFYLAKHPPRRPPRRVGRPRGPYVILTRGEIEKPYRRLWSQEGHRPSWREVACAMGVDERTLRRARREFGINRKPIEQSPE